MRSLRDRGEHAGIVDPSGEIAVDGHPVGRIDGLSLTIAEAGADADRRLLAAAARRAALPILRRRCVELGAAPDPEFAWSAEDTLTWREVTVARLRPGPSVLAPGCRPELDPGLDPAAQERVRRRLGRWLEGWVDRHLGALARLREAARAESLTGAARGIAYRLVELQGAMRRAEADSLIRDLTAADRRALARLGVRIGRHHVFLPDLLRPAAAEARARLLRIFHGRALPPIPAGRTVLRPPFPAQGDAMLSIGFAVFDGFAVRVDILERIAAQIRARARAAATFDVPPTLAAEAGLTRGELGVLVAALGFRPAPADDGSTTSAYTRPVSPAA